MKIITNQDTSHATDNVVPIDHFRPEHNRTITVLGQSWEVQMTAKLWESLELLKRYEGITENQLAMYAIDEMLEQEIEFDPAFRGVVAYLINRWKEPSTE